MSPVWVGRYQEDRSSDGIVGDVWRRETTAGTAVWVQGMREKFQSTAIVSEAVWREVCMGSSAASRGGERELSGHCAGVASPDRQEDLTDIIAADGTVCCATMQDGMGDEQGAEAGLGWVPGRG